MKIQEVCNWIEQDFYPRTYRWDNNGKQVGNFKNELKGILVALDLTSGVLKRAIKHNINLIITHHPFVFKKLRKEKKNIYKKEIFEQLQRHQIAVYSMHTSFDLSDKYSTSSAILHAINAENITSLQSNDIIKIGYLSKPVVVKTIVEQLKELFEIPVIQHNNVDLNKEITSVAVCAGGGGSEAKDIINKADLYITGEIKWNEWIEINELGINVICFNHYMENLFVRLVYDYLRHILPEKIVIQQHPGVNIIKYS